MEAENDGGRDAAKIPATAVADVGRYWISSKYTMLRINAQDCVIGMIQALNHFEVLQSEITELTVRR